MSRVKQNVGTELVVLGTHVNICETVLKLYQVQSVFKCRKSCKLIREIVSFFPPPVCSLEVSVSGGPLLSCVRLTAAEFEFKLFLKVA